MNLLPIADWNTKIDTHCSLCGQPRDPNRTEDGYTSCCNEPICYGRGCWVIIDEWETIHFEDKTSAEDHIAETKGNRA